MSICYLNGKEYQINEKLILNYIDTWSYKFSDDEKKKIVKEICFRLDSLEIDTMAIQRFNFVEDAYTDAAICYIFAHDNSVQALLDEMDDGEIFNYIGFGMPNPED